MIAFKEILRVLKIIVGSIILGCVAAFANVIITGRENYIELIKIHMFVFVGLGIMLIIGDYLMIVWDKIISRKKN